MATTGTLTAGVRSARSWGIRSGLSLLDQALISGSGLLMNMLLAQWLSPQAYGAFAVMFTAFLFLSGFHNASLLEPMTVIGGTVPEGRLAAYLASQIRTHVVVVGSVCGVAVAVAMGLLFYLPGDDLTRAFLGMVVASPLVLLFWLTRRMCYVLNQIHSAVLASAAYFAAVLIGVFYLKDSGFLSPLTAFLMTGSGSLIAAIIILLRSGQLQFLFSRNVRQSWKQVLLENWKYGRWLVPGTVLFSIANQAQLFLVAGFLGLGLAGTLRAMQLPALVLTQIVTSASVLLLSDFARDFGRGDLARLRNRTWLSSVTLSVFSAGYAALLLLFAAPVEQLLFGGKYQSYSWLIPVLCLVPVVVGVSAGFSMALRARQKPQFDLFSNLVAAPLGIVTAWFLIPRWGIGGAAASMIFASAASAIWVIVSHARES